MPRKKRVEYKDYQDYLNSPAWEQIKKDYAENEPTEDCTICGECFEEDKLTPHFHHFKYSKDWNDDTWENLIIVCKKCHDFLHEHITHDSDNISIRTYMRLVMYHKQFDGDLKNWVTISAYEEFIYTLFKKNDISITLQSEESSIFDFETKEISTVNYKGSIDFNTYFRVHNELVESIRKRALSDEF